MPESPPLHYPPHPQTHNGAEENNANDHLLLCARSSSLGCTWTELHSSAPAWSLVSIFMPTGWHMGEVNEQWRVFLCVCFGCKEKIRCIHACWLAHIRVWNGLDVVSAYLSCVCKVVALQLDHISRTSSCTGPSALSEGIRLDGADWTPEASLQVHQCLI